MEKQPSLKNRMKLYLDFYLLSYGAFVDFITKLPATIIRQGATLRSWDNAMRRIEMGKSFRDFMLSGKDLDSSCALNQ